MLRILTFALLAMTLIYSIEGDMGISSLFREKCKPVDCHEKIKKCAYGYQKRDGCEICKCNEPCSPAGKPVQCKSNERCHVEETRSGTFVGRCGPQRSKKDRNNKKNLPAICKQRKLVGPCEALKPRYFYNSEVSRCELFSYGGCKGNDNNFLTKSECERSCKV